MSLKKAYLHKSNVVSYQVSLARFPLFWQRGNKASAMGYREVIIHILGNEEHREVLGRARWKYIYTTKKFNGLSG